MIGGNQATFDQCKPIFDLMGKNVTLVGKNGDGQTTEVANQIIVATVAQELFNACVAHDGAAWDHSGMVRAIELLANHEIGQ